MKYGFTALMILLFSIRSVGQQPITIVYEPSQDNPADSLALEWVPIDYVGYSPDWNTSKQAVKNGKVTWKLKSSKALLVSLSPLFAKGKDIIEPGDSIYIKRNGMGLEFSGKGYEKFRLIKTIEDSIGNMRSPINPYTYMIDSLGDYMEWNRYLNRQIIVINRFFERYKAGLSSISLDFTKSSWLSSIEFKRIQKFNMLRLFGNKMGVGPSDLCQIFDSTIAPHAGLWIQRSSYLNNVHHLYALNRCQAFRRFSFDGSHDSLKLDSKRRLLYYRMAKNNYKGLVRERFLAYLITSKTIRDLYFVPETEAILADYYSSKDFPEYKKWVKAFELKERDLRSGQSAKDFKLHDQNGRLYTKEDIKGKIVLMDFWFTGCKGCVQINPVLKKVEHVFKDNPNVLFLSVSIDEDKADWIKSIEQKKYVTGLGINLYTNGRGNKHPMIHDYNILSYPRLFLLDHNGKIVLNPLPDPRDDNGEGLIRLIKKEIAFMYDGPYVMYHNDSMEIHQVVAGSLVTKRYPVNEPVRLQAQTHQSDKSFIIHLQPSLQVEPSEYANPEKMLVLSDLEGNFDAFYKLLLSGGIIDEHFNWTFGKGHLVLNGDLFDRGKQVAECLWLVYSLEEKAKKAGGYVHFILGNHEIMNMNGNTKYVNEKYKANARKLGVHFTDLYGPSSELGRWLRTKNIMEKIGNILFVHGGLSKEVTELSMSISEINDLARKYYDNEANAVASGNVRLKTLFNSNTSPFWYRSYYYNSQVRVSVGANSRDTIGFKTSQKAVDDVLSVFEVSKIITGHTIVSDSISTHYNGKVINVDTHHADGKSEALLISNNSYYRVNAEGIKRPLFQADPALYSTMR